MTDTVFPLQTILFQVIFLLVAIALEARVLHRKLRITRKSSVEYATSINLLAATLGWIGFFILQEFLPQPLKSQLISYIFFDRLLNDPLQSMNLVIAATGIGIFFASFIIKLKGLELLQALLRSPEARTTSSVSEKRTRPSLLSRMNRAIIHTDTNQAAAVLLANAYSHSAILLLLFLRFVQLNTLGGQLV
ncbi:MAG TPA: filament integrity protein FraC [Coleofasciculaceae cyanobacterium]